MKKETTFSKSEIKVSGDVIYLPVYLSNLPEKIKMKDTALYLKNSFHVSLVCIRIIEEKHNIQIPNFSNKVVEDFADFVKTNKVEILYYNDEFKFVTENDLRSIVVTCKVSNINGFFDLINKKYKLKIEYPPTHVTLYTLQNGMGIYLTDNYDIENLTVPIENPIGKLL